MKKRKQKKEIGDGGWGMGGKGGEEWHLRWITVCVGNHCKQQILLIAIIEVLLP